MSSPYFVCGCVFEHVLTTIVVVTGFPYMLSLQVGGYLPMCVSSYKYIIINHYFSLLRTNTQYWTYLDPL